MAGPDLPPLPTPAPVQQVQHMLTVPTSGKSFIDITQDVRAWLVGERAGSGIVTIFIRHTSASLTIQENADPAVQADLTDALDAIAPEDAAYRHASEGPDDMPAHIKSMVTSTSLGIPLYEGRLALGKWQGIYLIEHRQAPHRRDVALHFLGTVLNPTDDKP
ncbi:MAG: secondary thiamine-phosphate synthase enzyme YjbQ [Pseudomonadota bacterium]